MLPGNWMQQRARLTRGNTLGGGCLTIPPVRDDIKRNQEVTMYCAPLLTSNTQMQYAWA
jgi:hypothetical protein